MVSSSGCLMQCLVTHDETLGLCALCSRGSAPRAAGVDSPKFHVERRRPSLPNLLARVPPHALIVSWPLSGARRAARLKSSIRRTTVIGYRAARTPNSLREIGDRRGVVMSPDGARPGLTGLGDGRAWPRSRRDVHTGTKPRPCTGAEQPATRLMTRK